MRAQLQAVAMEALLKVAMMFTLRLCILASIKTTVNKSNPLQIDPDLKGAGVGMLRSEPQNAESPISPT